MMPKSPKDKDEPPGYLEGQLLVATPAIIDSCFARSVVYVCAHNSTGAMGLVINHTIENVSYGDILKQLSIPSAGAKRKMPVYFGGPVEAARGFVLHSADYAQEETIHMPNGISLTSNLQILRDIASGQGPQKNILALGYSGWSPGQLEAEIESNSWINVPASEKILFETDDSAKWQAAAQVLGVDMFKLTGPAGHA